MGVAAPVGLTFALMIDILEWGIIVALLWIWRRTFGKALLYLANLLNFRIHIPGVWSHTFNLGKPFAEVEHGMTEWMKIQKVGLEIEIAWTWHALGEIWHKTARMLEWAVDETAGALGRLEHLTIPKWAKWAAAAALPAALFSKIVAAVVAKIRPEIHKGVTVIEKTFPTKVIRIERKSVAVALPGALGIPKIWKEIHGLTLRNLRISRRLHRVEGLFAASVMAAAMANALGLGKNWRCITRGNIGRAARHLCGLDKWLLDFLLLGSVEAFVATDLCEFTHLLSEATKLQVPALMELVSVEDALIGCHGAEKPLQFKLPAASLPPLQGVSPLAA